MNAAADGVLALDKINNNTTAPNHTNRHQPHNIIKDPVIIVILTSPLSIMSQRVTLTNVN